MGFKCGIIGLPNVGKSTLFNALTESNKAEAANYPFATIEPNVGRVAVPDERLKILGEIGKSEKIIPSYMDFVDIAGLVQGASKGEGLGNKFLGHIREVDAIAHVVRCFEDENITHVSSTIDPLNDIETINTELQLADIETLETKKNSLEKKSKQGDKIIKNQIEIIDKLLNNLSGINNLNKDEYSEEDNLFIDNDEEIDDGDGEEGEEGEEDLDDIDCEQNQIIEDLTDENHEDSEINELSEKLISNVLEKFNAKQR